MFQLEQLILYFRPGCLPRPLLSHLRDLRSHGLTGPHQDSLQQWREWVQIVDVSFSVWLRYTLVLNWGVVLKCVEECNIQVPYHFGILKVSGFQKWNNEKNLTSPFWDNCKTRFLYLVRSLNHYEWFHWNMLLNLICITTNRYCTLLCKVFDATIVSQPHQCTFALLICWYNQKRSH